MQSLVYIILEFIKFKRLFFSKIHSQDMGKTLNSSRIKGILFIKQNLEGSVVIITGASSGLGKELALALCTKNIRLIITGRDKARLQQTKKQCMKIGNSQIITFIGDLTIPQISKKLIQETVENYNRIDTIFLNAGINSHFQFKEIKDTSIFQTLMNTNFYANVNLTQAVLPYIKHSNGKIIVISSLSGKFGLPSRTAYCASKFALNGFFEALRTQENIQIVMVYPTSLQTPMRKNNIVVNHKNQEQEQKNQNRQDPKKCAQQILKSIDEAQQDIYIPFKGMLGVILQPIFPNFIREKLKKSAKL